MSVEIVGGNERMERRYKDLCEEYGHKAKVYIKTAGLKTGSLFVCEIYVRHELLSCDGAANCKVPGTSLAEQEGILWRKQQMSLNR